MAVPNYKYSGVCYVATENQTTFALTTSQGESIGYLKQAHIKVRTSADSGNTWTWLTIDSDYVFADPATSIVLTAGAAAGELVDISRHTPMEDDYIDFQAGSLLTANQLNTFDTWQLYIDQELDDGKASIDGTTPGAAVKQVTGTEPILVDNTNPQAPVVGIDESNSTANPNALTSDTRVMSEKAIDSAFKQLIGTGPATGLKVGQLRIDDTGAIPNTFFWNGSSWVQIDTKGEKGDQGPPGPAPGLQFPAALAYNIANNPDGTVGPAVADVMQNAEMNLQFSFGIPQGIPGPEGPPGPGVTYKGTLDATTAPEPTQKANGDLYLNTGDGATSWTGLGTVTPSERLIWNASDNKWDGFDPPITPGGIQAGDPVSLLANDVGYITAADIPPSASTLQEVLDNGNTSTTDLWIGTGGETVKLLNTGTLEASAAVKGPSVEATGAGFSGTALQLSEGATVSFGTSASQKGNVAPLNDWSCYPART